MDISSVNSDLIRGNVTTIILGSLWNRDRYGYDILKEIELKSEGQYKLKQPTLYNQLKRLEKQGLISSYDGDPDDTGGGRRRYYSLTAEGRSFLEKERSEYEYSRTILDKLVSARQFDFDTTPAPFNTDDLRPYTKKDNSDKAKVVYKEKEKVVLVEKKIYIDAGGNEITEEEAQRLAEEGGQGRAVSEEEYARIQAEKQEEIERIRAEKDAELARIEEEKQAELERLAAEKEAELARIEEEKQAELERLEEEKQAEIERAEAEKQAELERLEEEKQAELEKLSAEKEADMLRAEEEKQAELERLAEEARIEREKLEAEHAEEVERLRAEKAAAEEEYAAKEAEYTARHIEELDRIAAEREEAEARFREEYAKFEEEKRAEEERRQEAERLDAERRAELERIENERLEAEKRFAEEREKFLAEKAEEDAKREAYERAEAEKREQAEREAREREEALLSQATMTLDDVFKNLDAESEYAKESEQDERLIVEGAEWRVETLPSRETEEEPVPVAEDAETEEEKEAEEEEEIKEEEEEATEDEPEAPSSEEISSEDIPSTATLQEIFRALDATSEYSDAKDKEEEYIIDDAEWVNETASDGGDPSDAPSAPVELTEEEELLAEEARMEDDAAQNEETPQTESADSALMEELVRLESERKAELERIARELEDMRSRMDSAPTYVYTERRTEVREAAADAEPQTVRQEAYVTEEDTSPRRAPEATLSEIFRRIEERDAAAAEEAAAAAETRPVREQAPPPVREELPEENAATQTDKGEYVVSAVRNARTEPFDYQRSDVNYREFFSSIADTQPERAKEPAERAIAPTEPNLKSRLYAEGFKLRSYDRRNTSEYYTFNFISANRLNRDCWLIMMAIFLVEAAVMWASLAREISYVYFLPIMAGGAALMLIPTIVWLINPLRRKRADFNLGFSVLNRGMMFIELSVILVLIAFFGVGVTVNDTVLILQTMVLPIILLTALPLSSLVYYGLYRSKRYHTA